MVAMPLHTLRTATRDAWANRGSFLLQVLIMVANDIVWIIFWTLFFHRVGNLRGWSLQDILVLWAVLTMAGGAALGVLANCRWVGQMASNGQLDEILVLPVSPLRYLLTTRINASNIGDMVFGLALFLLACNPTPERLLLFLATSLCATVVLVSFLVLAGSLSFFAGSRGEQTDSAFNAVLLFAGYPVDFFGGAIKVILYTVVPAAFVTGLPVSLMRHFDVATALIYIAVTAGIAALATTVFTLGLRRYSSGSIWT